MHSSSRLSSPAAASMADYQWQTSNTLRIAFNSLSRVYIPTPLLPPYMNSDMGTIHVSQKTCRIFYKVGRHLKLFLEYIGMVTKVTRTHSAHALDKVTDALLICPRFGPYFI